MRYSLSRQTLLTVLVAALCTSAGCDWLWPRSGVSFLTDQGTTADQDTLADQTPEGPLRDLGGEKPPSRKDAATNGCLIAGTRYAADITDPTDGCRICDPTVTTSAWSPNAGCVITFAGSGALASTDGPLATASFYKPHGIAIGGQGVIYVSDEFGHCIRRIANGQVSTLAGTCGVAGFANGKGGEAKFNLPHSLAVAPGGILYVADESNHRIRRIEGGNVSTLAGTGTAGSLNGPVDIAQFNEPRGVAVDSEGAVYVADSLNHCIRKIAGGEVSWVAGTCGVDRHGNSDGHVSTAQFYEPGGLAVAPNGQIVVADKKNNRIRIIAGTQVTLLAGSAQGFVDGPAAAARFYWPLDVALESSSALLIVDWNNYAIRRFTVDGQVATIAGKGPPASRGMADGPLRDAMFDDPQSIAIWKGVAYVTDELNNRIRALRIP